MKVKTLSVLIERDAMTVLPAVVPAHEHRIQCAVFGQDNVKVDTSAKTEPVDIEPDGEATRLENKWGVAALEKAYGPAYKGEIAKALAEAEVKAGK